MAPGSVQGTFAESIVSVRPVILNKSKYFGKRKTVGRGNRKLKPIKTAATRHNHVRFPKKNVPKSFTRRELWFQKVGVWLDPATFGQHPRV